MCFISTLHREIQRLLQDSEPTRPESIAFRIFVMSGVCGDKVFKFVGQLVVANPTSRMTNHPKMGVVRSGHVTINF